VTVLKSILTPKGMVIGANMIVLQMNVESAVPVHFRQPSHFIPSMPDSYRRRLRLNR
jgi:hypothetical protein